MATEMNDDPTIVIESGDEPQTVKITVTSGDSVTNVFTVPTEPLVPLEGR